MRRLAAIAIWLLLAGCSRDCPTFALCDIRTRSCQERTLNATQCLRGGSTRLPKVTLVSEAQLLQRYNREAMQDDQGRQQFGLFSDGLALFDLAPTDYTADQALAAEVGQTAAAYFERSKDIAVVDRGVALDDERAVVVLAHEVVHALQDADYDLRSFERRWASDFDSSLAISGLIEGEAVTYQLMASAALQGGSPEQVDWQALYERFRAQTLRDAERDPAPVSSAGVYFPYAFGGAFVTERWLAHGRAGIDRLFQQPPTTTREILFGRVSGVRDEQRALDRHALPALPDSYARVGDTALGAWIARLYGVRVGLHESAAAQLAMSLAADRFSVFADANAGVIAAWRLRTLGDAGSAPWPGAGHGMIELGGSDSRETYLLAGESTLPTAADQIAWRASSPADKTPASGAAAYASALRHRACNELRSVHE